MVVHGANALRDELAERLGAPKRVLTSVSGYSSVYSDDCALDMIMLAYAGLRNTSSWSSASGPASMRSG